MLVSDKNGIVGMLVGQWSKLVDVGQVGWRRDACLTFGLRFYNR